MATLFVCQLSYDTTEDAVAALFEAYRPMRVKLITDKETGRSKAFAFVDFYSDHDATRAMQELDGAELDGRSIVVKPGRPRSEVPRPTGPQRPVNR
jgi:RNA recognition motif-containing protein